MSEADKQGAANWSILVGGLLLFISLFLTWSYQFSPVFRTRLPTGALFGVPRAATAWQVYSAMDILLCLLASVLAWCAVSDHPTARRVTAASVCAALAFVVHALGAPPTNGLLVSLSATHRYSPTGASPGAGEIVALAGLALALVGLARSFTPAAGGAVLAS